MCIVYALFNCFCDRQDLSYIWKELFFDLPPMLNYKSAPTNLLHASTAAIPLSSVYFCFEIWMALRPCLKVISLRTTLPDASLQYSFHKVVWLLSALHSFFPPLLREGEHEMENVPLKNSVWNIWLVAISRLFDFVIQKTQTEWRIVPFAAKQFGWPVPIIHDNFVTF